MVRQLGNSKRTNHPIWEESTVPGVSVAPTVVPADAEGGRIAIGSSQWIERQHIELSQADDFQDAITRVGTDGDIWIDQNETLLAATVYDVPYGVTLVGSGGVLSVQSDTTLNVKGPVESMVKIFDHASHAARGTIDIFLGVINIRWFGALNSGEAGADGIDNKNALVSAWLAGRNVDGKQSGGVIYVPGPAEFDVTKLDFSALAGGGQRVLRGDTQRGSSFRVESGADEGLLDASSSVMSNGAIEHLSFSGLRGVNTTNDPVVLIDSSNFEMNSCHVVEGSSNGLEVKTAVQVILRHVDSESHNGWGFYLHGGEAVTLDACETDNCDTGGLLIERDEAQSNDRNEFSSYIVNNFHAKNTPICVKLAGVGGVLVNGITSNGNNTTEVLRLATYTDGGGRIWPASGNIIHIHGLIGDNQKIIIEAGCVDNLIILPPTEILNVVIEDANASGLNKVIVQGGQSSVVQDSPPAGNDKNYANVFQDASYNTRPLALDQVSGTETESYIKSFIIHPAAAHLTSQNDHISLSWVDSASVPPVNNRLRIFKTSMPAADYWINMLVWSDYNVYFRIQLQRADADVLDWTTGTFLASGTATVSKKTIRIEGGRPQWVSVPFTLPTVENLIVDVLFQDSHNSNRMRCQYFAVVDKANAGLIYQDGASTPIGSGDYFESTTSNLPAASEVPLGTKVFDSTLSVDVVTDNTDWVPLAIPRLVIPQQPLTFSTALVWNTDLGLKATVLLTGNTKPDLLSGAVKNGETNTLVVEQDATGGRHIDWSNFVGDPKVSKKNGSKTTFQIYIESATIQHVSIIGRSSSTTRRIILYPSSSFTNIGGGATNIYDRVVTDTTWSWSDVRKYEFCTYGDLQYTGPIFDQTAKDKLTTVIGNATNIKVLAFIRQDLWWYWNESLIQFPARQWGTIVSKPTVGMGGDLDDGILWATNQAVIEAAGYSQPTEHDSLTDDGALLTNPYEIAFKQSPKEWWARNNRMDIADETWLDLLTDNIVEQRKLEMKVHGWLVTYQKINNYVPSFNPSKQLHEWIAGTGNPGWSLSSDSGGSGAWSDPSGTVSELYDSPKANTVVDVVDSATKIIEMLRYKDPGAILVFSPHSLSIDGHRNPVQRTAFRASAIAKHSFITDDAEADVYWAEQISYCASMCDASGGGIEFGSDDDADDFSVEWADALRGLDRGFVQRVSKPQNISILADQ